MRLRWALLLVLAAAFLIRANALWTPHWRGDQAQYIILAMKLANFGLDGYNLRGADMGHLDVSPSKDERIEFNVVKPGIERDEPGAYLTMLKGMGQAYYDEPLHVRAPLFPAILAASHSFLSPRADRPVFMVLSYGPETWKTTLGTGRLWARQAWAALVPLAFNLGLIALTAALAWLLFGSSRIAVLAAALLAVNPLSIWLAHKVLTEDVAAFFSTASICSLVLLWRVRRSLAGLAAGVLAGAAVLTNQRVALTAVAAGLFAVVIVWQDLSGQVRGRQNGIAATGLKALRLALDPFFWAFAAGSVAVSGFWFWRMIRTYGHPLYMPQSSMANALTQDVTGWFAAVHSRPHPSLLFSFGVLALCPWFLFAFTTWRQAWEGWHGRSRDSATRGLALLWTWAAVYYLGLSGLASLFTTGMQEHRYFYPAYPALAVLAAFGLDRLCSRAADRGFFPRQGPVVTGILTALFLAAAGWGTWLAYPKVFSDQMLF